MKNKTCKRLTAAQKRVEIAKDVILQIENGFYDAMKGDYISVTLNERPFIKGKRFNLQKKLKYINKCNCCMKGALFISKVAKFNNVFTDNTFNDLDDNIQNYASSDICDNLKEFDQQQLHLIEAVFEGWPVFGRFDELELKKIEEFYNEYEDEDDPAKARMIAICKNIIKNKGTFVL